MNLGPMEIGGILLLFVLLFGAKKLPDLGSSVGKSIKNFKKGLNEPPDADEKAAAQAADGTTTTGETHVPTGEPTVPPATQTARHDT